MRLEVAPPYRFGSLEFGTPIQDAVDIAGRWGNTRGAGPAPGRVAFKTLITHPEFEVVLLCDDGETLTAAEAWRFENEEADVHVTFEGIDVFRKPARELNEYCVNAGHFTDTSDEEVTVLPELSLLLSRETSREVPLDPEDGLPLYFHYVLAAPSGYFD